ncbi:MAG: tRNA (adenosine(37)-N6)-threonylcarbamoyltransferase complex dimerization subunit type 1 TsaB [Bacteroidales bacterium]|jgi:tRNA threonylcarbamoyladenosine biosynthesis protein TsaB|nr:tRNA (adenosine(37)-N6)-threonylcarbamoyltransferase complex dimerization subunit type 1 TsaB [Bacteroidales bacterium]
MILCLETATSHCSVALCGRNGPAVLKESGEGRSHASLLTVLIDEILREAGIKAGSLEAVAVSKGPGSYTGLRIGVSAAKGIAYAVSIPLISVETTFSMFSGFHSVFEDKYSFTRSDLFCPMLDARRMEIYYSLFDSAGNSIRSIRAGNVDRDFLADITPGTRIFAFGDAVLKCAGVPERRDIIFEESFRISASYMQKAAYDSLDNGHFEDVAYFEPFYLKDFIATIPSKNILGI